MPASTSSSIGSGVRGISERFPTQMRSLSGMTRNSWCLRRTALQLERSRKNRPMETIKSLYGRIAWLLDKEGARNLMSTVYLRNVVKSLSNTNDLAVEEA